MPFNVTARPRVRRSSRRRCLPRENLMRHGSSYSQIETCSTGAQATMRTARLIVIAAIIDATAGAAIVFTLLDRLRGGKNRVAARTWLRQTPRGRCQPARPDRGAGSDELSHSSTKSPAEAQNSADQKVPPAPTAEAATDPQRSELATTPTSRSVIRPVLPALAEAPAVKDTPSAQTLNNMVAVAPDPAPAPKPQSKKPRMTSRTVPRNGAPRYDSRRYYAGSYDAPRYGYEPRYGFEQGSRGFAWAPYGPHDY